MAHDWVQPYLHERLATGHCNATVLLGEITERDTRRLQHCPPLPAAATPHRGYRSGSAVTATWTSGGPSGRRVDHRPPGASRSTRCPELDAAARHVAGFARMIKNLSGDRDALTGWMGAVDGQVQPSRRSR